MPQHYDLTHADEPLTEARIASVLARLSWLEQACDRIGDGNGTGALNLLVGAALVCLAGGAVLLWSGWVW